MIRYLLLDFWGNVHKWKQTLFRLYYSSLTTPVSYYDYDLKSGNRDLLKQDEVFGWVFILAITLVSEFLLQRETVKKYRCPVVYRKDKF